MDDMRASRPTAPPKGAKAPTERWPNLFLVGVTRGGTSSLAHAMSQHSSIYVSPLKEPHYFSPPRRRLVAAVHDEDAYLRLFAGATTEQWRCDASSSYFWDEETAAAIKRVAPDARIVISLRDPIERANSHYWLGVRNGTESRSFMEAIDAELQSGAEHQVAHGFGAYVDRGFYVERLQRYLSAFGGDVLVLHFEDFARDPVRQLRKVFRFLSVDEDEAAAIRFERKEAFSLPRNRVVGKLYGSRPGRAAGRLLVPSLLRPHVERTMLSRHPKPLLSEDARRVLARTYGDERKRLEALLDETLPWDPWPT